MFPTEEEMALMLKKGLPQVKYKDLLDVAHEISKEAKQLSDLNDKQRFDKEATGLRDVFKSESAS